MPKRGYLDTTVASRSAVRRCVPTASTRSEAIGFESHYVRRREYYNPLPKQNSRGRVHHNDDEDEYSRPNKMTIFSQINDVSNDKYSSKLVRLKSNNRGCETYSKQLDSEYSYRNDQSMNNFGQRRSFTKRNYSYGAHRNFKNSPRVLKESETGWYSIYVQNVDQNRCDEVIKLIQCRISPARLYPYNIHFIKSSIVFTIDDFKTAKILYDYNCREVLLGNQKLTLRVTHYQPIRHTILMSSEIKEKMAQAIANHYNPNTKCLDLSKFHSFLLFTENKLFLPLNRPEVLKVALHIAAEYVKHDLQGLSLRFNFIFCGEGLEWICRLFPELKVLNLSDNKLTHLKNLQSLTGFNIEELNLLKNPVNETEDKEYYNQKVLEMFPSLKKLDEIELQSFYTRTVDLKLKMPVNHLNYPITEGHEPKLPNSVTTFVESFLTQYFDMYDNKVSRKRLNETYHDNAVFTLSNVKLLKPFKGNLSYYEEESRNCTQTKNGNCLHKSKKNIIKCLEKLPRTKHDFGSFKIDVPLANSAIVHIVVNGVFSENYDESDNRHSFKSFCRIFHLKSYKSGWYILRDMLFVTLPTDEIIMESVKRFKALKQLNESNFNSHDELNNPIRFMEDSGFSSSKHLPFMLPSYHKPKSTVSVNSQQSSFHNYVSDLQNKQKNPEHHVTPPATMTLTQPVAMTLQSIKEKSMTMLNMTQSPSSPPVAMALTPPVAMALTPPVAMALTPPVAMALTPPVAMTLQSIKEEPNSMPMTILNMTQSPSPPPVAMTLQSIKEEPNSMPMTILNMTQSPSPPLVAMTLQSIKEEPNSMTMLNMTQSPSSPPVAMTLQSIKEEPNSMSMTILNMTQSQSSPPVAMALTPPVAMTLQSIKEEPNSMTMLNMTQSASTILQQQQFSSIPVSSSSTNVPSDPIYINTKKLALIKKLSFETGMNITWTKKCLEENCWDYTKATLSFSQLKPCIPPEAYIHFLN